MLFPAIEIMRARPAPTAMKSSVCFALLALAGLGCLAMPASALELESKATKTHLLELFTSEGCSSCPPAEAGLSKLKDNPRLWQDFVPVAFHVDYWDRLGWRDPFAAKAWTARQYEYSARWKNSSVYTPGFVLDGREWRNSAVPSASSESPGALKLSVTDSDAVRATFQSDKPLDVHVARLGFGLNVNVKAGENSGRKLLHDFVVLSLETAKMNDGKAELRAPVAPGKENVDGRTAIVAWVTEPGQIEPIQAVGGWVR